MVVAASFVDGLTALLEEQNWLTITVAVVAVMFFWRRDIGSPEKNASASVLTGIATGSKEFMEMAIRAMKAAEESAARSHECSERNLELERYIRKCVAEMVSHGITPPPPPFDMEE